MTIEMRRALAELNKRNRELDRVQNLVSRNRTGTESKYFNIRISQINSHIAKAEAQIFDLIKGNNYEN